MLNWKTLLVATAGVAIVPPRPSRARPRRRRSPRSTTSRFSSSSTATRSRSTTARTTATTMLTCTHPTSSTGESAAGSRSGASSWRKRPGRQERLPEDPARHRGKPARHARDPEPHHRTLAGGRDREIVPLVYPGVAGSTVRQDALGPCRRLPGRLREDGQRLALQSRLHVFPPAIPGTVDIAKMYPPRRRRSTFGARRPATPAGATRRRTGGRWRSTATGTFALERPGGVRGRLARHDGSLASDRAARGPRSRRRGSESAALRASCAERRHRDGGRRTTASTAARHAARLAGVRSQTR